MGILPVFGSAKKVFLIFPFFKWLNGLKILFPYWCLICFAVMRRNPFVVDGCCRKGSRNALQELYNPTQVGGWHAHIAALFMSLSRPSSVPICTLLLTQL